MGSTTNRLDELVALGHELYQPREVAAKWPADERYKLVARRIVHSAIATGALVPQPCERCKRAAYREPGHKRVVQAHHENYGRPLTVRWLCQRCHAKQHGGPRRSSRNT